MTAHPSDPADEIVRRHPSAGGPRIPSLPTVRRSPADLALDQPTVPLESVVSDEAGRALAAGGTHYVEVAGMPPLLDALAASLRQAGLADLTASSLLVAAGVQEARFLAIQALSQHLGALGIPAVVHPGARQAAAVRETPLVELPVDPDRGYLATVAGVQAALADGCRLLYLESPSRLTGAAFDAVAVREIAALVARAEAAVIWDLGLAPWVPADPAAFAAPLVEPGLAERTIALGEAWPGAGLDGLPIGFVATANDEWLARIRSLKQLVAICTSTPSQHAALAVAERYAVDQLDLRASLLRRRQLARDLARAAGLVVLDGHTASVLALGGPTVTAAADALRRAGFAFADGAEFGAPGTIRLSVTPDDTVLDALRRVVDALGGDRS